jgi:hypothetical protein
MRKMQIQTMCPLCKAEAGQPCKNVAGYKMWRVHRLRLKDAKLCRQPVPVDILPTAPYAHSGLMEEKRVARTAALRRYITLLQQEERRLNQVRRSPRAKQQDRDSAETGLRSVAEKILHADKELRELESKCVRTLSVKAISIEFRRWKMATAWSRFQSSSVTARRNPTREPEITIAPLLARPIATVS